jgi:YegS/Rv2252/BmrU family lipid kinase
LTNVLILNPVSGGGYVMEKWPEIKRSLQGLDYTTVITERPGHAEEIAREAVNNNAEYVICAGGDGTLNEALQGMVGTETALVPISAGTGSDFIRSSPLDTGSITGLIRDHARRRIDCGIVRYQGGERYFLNILEIGFGASVMQRVNARKNAKGGNVFIKSVLREIWDLKYYEMVIGLSHGTEDIRATEIIIANGKYFGGGMKASPNSVLDDGMLDVHIIKDIGMIRMLAGLSSLRNGKYVGKKTVRNMILKNISVGGDPAPIEADGETLGTTPAMISVVPESLYVLSDS